MPRVKVAVIGAGSYVFGASILEQALLDHRLDGIELALMDVNQEMLEPMGGVGRRLVRELGLESAVTTHLEREAALDGADFVLCAVAQQIHRRFEMDCAIIDRFIPAHWATEFGGVAGISYSLRQIAFITDLAASMRRCCPGTWLLDSANPLPRVCQAAHESGVPTAGFCSVSIGGLNHVWTLFGGEPLPYPFAAAQQAYEATMAGVNHFSWLLELRSRVAGEDLMPELRRRIAERTDASRSEALARETGHLPMSGDGHIRDFLEPLGPPRPRHAPHHGNAEERRERLALLRNVAEGLKPPDRLFEHPAWERPLDFVAAMAFGRPCTIHALNLVNAGQIANLPRDVFVETPCNVGADGPEPHTIELPPAVQPYAERTARVSDAIVRAAMKRSRRLVHHSIGLDPTIVDKAAGIRAIDACLEAHADLLPEFGD